MTFFRHRSTLYLLTLVCLLMLAGHVRSEVTAKQIERALSTLETNESLSESRKTALKEQLDQMLNDLRQISELDQKARDFEAMLDSLPNRIHTTESEIKRLERNPPAFALSELSNMSLDTLQQNVSRTSSRVALLNTELADLKELYLNQKERPAVIRTELQALYEQKDAAKESVAVNAKGASDVDRMAREWASEIRHRLSVAKRQVLEKELASNPVQQEWSRIQISQKTMLLDFASQELTLKESKLAELRTADAETYRQQSLEDAAQLESQVPIIREVATRNASLSNILVETTNSISDASASTVQINEQMTRLASEFERTRQKIEVAGLSQALGQVLLEERRRLSGVAYQSAQNLVSQKKIAEVGLRQIQHEEERQSLRVPRKVAEEKLKSIEPVDAAAVHDEYLDLLEKRRKLLDRMVLTDQNYLQALSDLDFALRQLRERIDEYRGFITERLLWIRSSQAIDLPMLTGIPSQVLVFSSLSLWERFFKDMGVVAQSHWWASIVYVVVLLVFLRERRAIRERVKASAVPLKRLTTDHFLYTVRALVWSAVLALPLASLLMLLGIVLQSTDGLGKLATAAGPAFWDIGRFLFFLQFLRQLSKSEGVFRAHFKWKDRIVDAQAMAYNKLLYGFVPVLLVAIFLVNYDFGSAAAGLTHLTFMVTMLIFSYLLLSLLSGDHTPAPSETAEPVKSLTVGLKTSSHRVLRVLFFVGPLVLAIVGLMGYLYTASTLCLRFLDTFSFVIVLVVTHQMVMRWLLLAQRKLAYQNALERRAAMRQKAAEGPADDVSSFESQLEVEEPKIDLEAVSKGGRELLNTVLAICGATGIWFIWAEILPAFSVLDEFSLWEYTDMVGGNEVQVPVTIFDLGLALLIVAVTALAAKRVPALLEFILLQRLNLSAGGLYTVKTLSGYVIAAVGILVTFGTIGMSWSQIQWLAAALSVGIGFGLQEIVANFISGLIILFERPIRVGDVVTVGDTDGVVTKINIRATTIRNWDQKELLVPNKEFITGRLLNWTLSDQTTRIYLKVGIAYGSDVEKAMAIVHELVKTQTNVMVDPAPSVFFETLGDNALIISLRAYVAKLEYRLPTISELHTRIYKALNEAEIAIAFPQRDIHLDTLKPLEVKVVGDTLRS